MTASATDHAEPAPADGPATPLPDDAAPRLGPRDLVVGAVLVAAVCVPLWALFKQSGPPMEEGFMLVFPERVLAGDIPNEDFLHLYGPGSLWALAGWFKVFGTSLASERAFGLLQSLGIIFGMATLARPWGRRVATAVGLTAILLVLTAIGLVALAWNGGVALGLWGLVCGLRAHREGPDATRWWLAAGVLGGLALTFRPDLIMAVGLGLGSLLLGRAAVERTRLLLGVALGASPYLVHLATAGPANVFEGMFLDPVFRLRGGRHLPVPPSFSELDGALSKVAALRPVGWSLPAPDTPNQVWLWFWLLPLTAVALVVLGVVRRRQVPGSIRAQVLLTVGLFGLGMLPQALQRPDSTHLAWVSCVAISFLPVLLTELLGRGPLHLSEGVARSAGAALGLALLLVVVPHFTYRTYVDLTRQTFQRDFFGSDVHRDGRNFYLGSEPIVPAAQGLIDDLDRLAEPGQRLLVAPHDMRKTPYSDAYLYFLFPELVPGTYYIEMDPGMANREGSGLAEEVAQADWLVRSRAWAPWAEPNDSLLFGSNEPNEVAERLFCKVEEYPGPAGFGAGEVVYFELWQRCR